MATISGVQPSSVYGYSATTAKSAAKPAEAAQTAAAQPPVNTFTASGSSSSTPLTYNATGLLASSRTTAATTSAQAAQQAFFAAENVVTQTLNSLASGTSSSPSGSDTSSLFSLPGTTGTSDPFGLSQAALPNTKAGNSSAQNAQNAVLAAQNAVTDTLNSLASGFSSNTPSSGV